MVYLRASVRGCRASQRRASAGAHDRLQQQQGSQADAPLLEDDLLAAGRTQTVSEQSLREEESSGPREPDSSEDSRLGAGLRGDELLQVADSVFGAAQQRVVKVSEPPWGRRDRRSSGGRGRATHSHLTRTAGEYEAVRSRSRTIQRTSEREWAHPCCRDGRWR